MLCSLGLKLKNGVRSLDYGVLSRDLRGRIGNVSHSYFGLTVAVEGDLNSLSLMLQKQVLELVCLMGLSSCGGY